MARWKYRIELMYINEGEQLPIREENIRTFVIDHDYEEKNMPTMFAKLTIDKNFFDKIVLNASKANMLLTLSKINIDSNNEEETIYNSMCEYFIDNDINYNKDVDYDKDEHTKDREDIYTEVSIGLMFLDPITWNKQTVNTTVIEATMMNIVGLFIENIPTLIESFDYNDTFDQLIIPPQDSLLDVLKFLNNLKVFYDTSYRVFFEGDGLYLLSSSGRPTKKKNEQYDTVVFIVFPADSDEASALGMGVDDNAKCYVANISALETDYKIDHDTGKQYTQLQAVINPSIENSITSLPSIKDIGDQIKSITSGFGSVLEDAAKSFEKIPGVLSDIKHQWPVDIQVCGTNTDSAIDAINKAYEKIKAMPEESSGGGGGSGSSENTLSKKEKERIRKELDEIKVNLSSNNNKYKGIVADYDTGMSNSLDILGNITGSGGCFGGVSPTNAKSNVNKLKDILRGVGIDTGNNIQHYGEKLTPYIDVMKKLGSLCTDALNSIQSSGIEMDKIKPNLDTLGISRGCFGDLTDKTKANLGSYSKYLTVFNNTNDLLEPFTKKMDAIQTNLQSVFTETLTNIATLGENAEKTLSSIVNRASGAIDKLSANGLSIDKLGEITKNLASVKSIDGIGKLTSSFKIDLDLGDRGGGCFGTKVIRVDNDNPNALKNIKSDIENGTNKFSLRKQDMDISVFNLNKRYIIRNYDAHSDKDGTFLLTRRMDMFSREDDKFKCLCQLWFNKIANDNSRPGVDGQPTDPELLAKIAEDLAHAQQYIDFVRRLKQVM